MGGWDAKKVMLVKSIQWTLVIHWIIPAKVVRLPATASVLRPI
jgi:hypothetical protein